MTYTPVYIGLRPLYQDGQYYSIEQLEAERITLRVHFADGRIEEAFADLTKDEAVAMVSRFEGAGLQRGPSSLES